MLFMTMRRSVRRRSAGLGSRRAAIAAGLRSRTLPSGNLTAFGDADFEAKREEGARAPCWGLRVGTVEDCFSRAAFFLRVDARMGLSFADRGVLEANVRLWVRIEDVGCENCSNGRLCAGRMMVRHGSEFARLQG